MCANHIQRGGKLIVIVLAIALGTISSNITAGQSQILTGNGKNGQNQIDQSAYRFEKMEGAKAAKITKKLMSGHISKIVSSFRRLLLNVTAMGRG